MKWKEAILSMDIGIHYLVIVTVPDNMVKPTEYHVIRLNKNETYEECISNDYESGGLVYKFSECTNDYPDVTIVWSEKHEKFDSDMKKLLNGN
jgi:hypothetical protein